MNNNPLFQEVIEVLQNDGIAVVRTDTIYGIIARAASEAAVEKVYSTKGREPNKQCIVLIANVNEVPTQADVIARFSVDATRPTSIVVPASNEAPWLLRGGDTIAYRLVSDPFLKAVVEKIGPVIAPSANPEGLPPARSIDEARAYFGDRVDVYVDGGIVPENAAASRIVRIDADGSISQIRS